MKYLLKDKTITAVCLDKQTFMINKLEERDRHEEEGRKTHRQASNDRETPTERKRKSERKIWIKSRT